MEHFGINADRCLGKMPARPCQRTALKEIKHEAIFTCQLLACALTRDLARTGAAGVPSGVSTAASYSQLDERSTDERAELVRRAGLPGKVAGGPGPDHLGVCRGMSNAGAVREMGSRSSRYRSGGASSPRSSWPGWRMRSQPVLPMMPGMPRAAHP
jgi:hypothetical protein